MKYPRYILYFPPLTPLPVINVKNNIARGLIYYLRECNLKNISNCIIVNYHNTFFTLKKKNKIYYYIS